MLFAHLGKLLNALIGPGQLVSKHLDIVLDALRDAALSVHLEVQSAQVFQLHQLLLHVPLVLQGRREGGRLDRRPGALR